MAGADLPTRARAAGPQIPADGLSRFAVILRGVRIGSESVDVVRTPGSIRISSFGSITAPFDLVTHKFEMTYSTDWQPQQLAIEGTLRGQPLTLGTTFGLTTATSDLLQGVQRGSVTHPVSPRAVVLPSNFFGAYEALAARLASVEPGARLPIYVAPETEITGTVERVTPRRITGPSGSTALRQFDVSLSTRSGSSPIEVWVDERGRLARLVIRAAALVVIRDDLSSVMMREERVRHAGDEEAFIPASGFNLAATVTSPATKAGAGIRAPAVVLVGSSGRQDRDETLYGVPMFGHLAGGLADAGFVVARYDKRGVGQSGGRPEHAGITEYAEDVQAVLTWLRRRKDVDGDRLAIVSHGEGAAVALAAAAREKRVRGVVLVAAPGRTGREVSLDEQDRTLRRLNDPPADRQAKIALQQRVMDAVVSGKGWDALASDLRRQADTPWFRSWLLFDPEVAVKKVTQPVLVLHGALDTEMPPDYADRLEAFGLARRQVKPGATTKIVLPGINHLLTPASTGDVDEYESLSSQPVAAVVIRAIVDWLKALR